MTAMNTETAQPAAQQHGTYHFILTVQKAEASGGYSLNTFSGTITATGMTRKDAYDAILAEHTRVNPHMAGANVTFFSFEPNQL